MNSGKTTTKYISFKPIQIVREKTPQDISQVLFRNYLKLCGSRTFKNKFYEQMSA